MADELTIANKKAEDQVDYDVDFTRWLGADDTVVSVTGEGQGVIVDKASVYKGTIVKIWLSGGTSRQHASVVLTVTSSLGRVKSLLLRLRID